MNARMIANVVAVTTVLVCAHGLQAAAIQTVPVRHPGNASDGATYGAVGYEYRIGRFEVTAGQYAEFLNSVAATDAYGVYEINMWSAADGCKIQQLGTTGSFSYVVNADWADRPVNYVSWGDAARYANWLHNDQPGLVEQGVYSPVAQDADSTEDGSYYLDGAVSTADLMAVTRESDATWAIPSEDEWYKAAYYDGAYGVYYDYPTGSDTMPENKVVEPDSGNSANFQDAQNVYTIGPPYYRTEVGEFQDSASPYGTFDQAGNVTEWNEAADWTSSRGLWGGSFSNSGDAMASDARHYYGVTGADSTIGFRVVQIPEPTTLSLIVFGGLAFRRRRKRRR